MPGDDAAYSAERDRLVNDIVEALGDTVTQLKALNRNMEALNQVGEGFDSMDVWARFHERIRGGGAENE